jgi:hypothetical protein
MGKLVDDRHCLSGAEPMCEHGMHAKDKSTGTTGSVAGEEFGAFTRTAPSIGW